MLSKKQPKEKAENVEDNCLARQPENNCNNNGK